jgi:hypothetical protein
MGLTCGFSVGCVIDYPYAAAQTEALAQEFPGFAVSLEPAEDKIRYIAKNRHPDVHPRMVVTSDVAELRAALNAGHVPA